jgi:hypothetical protein
MAHGLPSPQAGEANQTKELQIAERLLKNFAKEEISYVPKSAARKA